MRLARVCHSEGEVKLRQKLLWKQNRTWNLGEMYIPKYALVSIRSFQIPPDKPLSWMICSLFFKAALIDAV